MLKIVQWLNRFFGGRVDELAKTEVLIAPKEDLSTLLEEARNLSDQTRWQDPDGLERKTTEAQLKEVTQKILKVLPQDFQTAILRILVRYYDIIKLLDQGPGRRQAALADVAHKAAFFLNHRGGSEDWCEFANRKPEPITPIDFKELFWWIIGLGKGSTSSEKDHLAMVANKLRVAIDQRELAGRQIALEEMSDLDWDSFGHRAINIFLFPEWTAYTRALLDIYCELGPEGEAFVRKVIFGQSDQNPES